MNVGNKFLLAALRSAYGEATAANPVVVLRTMLLGKSSGAFALVAGGSIKSTSANGQETVLADSSEGPTPTQLIESWTYLIELHDRAKVALGGNPNDAQIEAKMETYLRDVTGYVNDWRYLEK